MAHRSNPRTTRSESIPSASFLWGLALLALALLIFLALVSWSASDWPATEDMVHSRNWIGYAGAILAHTLGPFFLGRWAAFGIVIVIGIWGWTLLRRLHWQRPFVLSVWTLVFAFWLSAFFGLAGGIWPGLKQVDYYPHSGQFGAWASENLTVLLGYTGAVVLLLLILIVGLAFSVAGFAGWFERGVNKTIDRVSDVKLPRIRRRSRDEFSADGEAQEATDVLPSVPESGETEDTEARGLRKLGKMISRREKTQPASQLAIQIEDRTGYVFPPLDLFNPPKPDQVSGMSPEDQQRHSELLEKTLATFGVQARAVRVNPGPVITRFDLEPAPGVKVSRIEASG